MPRRNITSAGGLNGYGLSVAYGKDVYTSVQVLPDTGKVVPMLDYPGLVT
jgi:hypothetical protein